MAGNRITWDIGSYDPDTHYVYRSDAPMDPNSLPTPIATLGQGISVYEDTNNIVKGNTYYYRVDAEKMGLYIPGYEIKKLIYSYDVFGDNSALSFYEFNGNASSSGGTWPDITLPSNTTFDTYNNIDYVKFDGTSNGTRNDFLLQNLPSAEWTISFWAKQLNDGMLFNSSAVENTNDDFSTVIRFSNSFYSSKNQNSSPTVSVPNDNNFHHYIMTKDTNNIISVYLDGSFIDSASNSIDYTTHYLMFGSRYRDNTTYKFEGGFTVFRSFNRNINDSEATLLYNELKDIQQ